MMQLPLAQVPFIMNVVMVLFFFVAIALIAIVLIQKGKGGGLSSAFGGGGSSSVFGSKTGDFLTWATISVAVLFLVLAVVMTKYYKPRITELGGPAQPAQKAPAAPAPAPQKAAPVAPAQK